MRDLFLLVHFVGLVMALGTGFATYFLLYAASKLEPAEQGKFLGRIIILTRMGQIGLAILILSGLYLMTPFWSMLSEMPTLIAKLSLVALQVILIFVVSMIVSKAQGDPAKLATLKPLRMVNFAIGLTILVLAVLTFH